MQKLSEITLQDVENLRKRVQHLEEEVAKLKMKTSGKRWL
jgi:polyhydroxyalkanoate synthesis regulator phasin